MAPGVLNCCFAVVRWLPVIFITAIIVWSYYAYVVQMCLFTVENIPEKVLYLLLYHPLLVLFAWAYWKTIFTDVGTPTKEFYLSPQEVFNFEREENDEVQRDILARVGRNLPIQCRTASGAYRYCDKCKCLKPDRAHHCSVCGTVNNCVGFSNYKFFVLFLGYGLLYCLYCSATSLQYFIRFWAEKTHAGLGKFHILFLFFAAVMFGCSLVSLYGYHVYLVLMNRSTLGESSNRDMSNLHIVFLFFAGVMFAISLISLFGYHCWLTAKNRSTLESFRAPIFRSGPDKNGFSLGRSANFQEVFGDSKKMWFIPMSTSLGNGLSYPTRVTQPPNSYQSMEQSPTTPSPSPGTEATNQKAASVEEKQQGQQSFGDGITYPIRTVDEDYDSLLGQRQRWMEEGDMENTADALPGLESSTDQVQKSSVFIQSSEEE